MKIIAVILFIILGHFSTAGNIETMSQCLLCDDILKNVADGNVPRLSYPCWCIIGNIKKTMEELENQVETLTTELNETKNNLTEVTEHLETVCPDSTSLKTLCNESDGFEFLESDDGCRYICFKAIVDLSDYATAKTACTNAGAKLIILDTLDKNSLMVYKLQESYASNSFWINLEFVDNEWKWDGTTTATFTNWAENEPDNNQNCASLNTVHGHKWFDWYCSQSNKNGALCEITTSS